MPHMNMQAVVDFIYTIISPLQKKWAFPRQLIYKKNIEKTMAAIVTTPRTPTIALSILLYEY
jgi:hypothetical protein